MGCICSTTGATTQHNDLHSSIVVFDGPTVESTLLPRTQDMFQFMYRALVENTDIGEVQTAITMNMGFGDAYNGLPFTHWLVLGAINSDLGPFRDIVNYASGQELPRQITNEPKHMYLCMEEAMTFIHIDNNESKNSVFLDPMNMHQFALTIRYLFSPIYDTGVNLNGTTLNSFNSKVEKIQGNLDYLIATIFPDTDKKQESSGTCKNDSCSMTCMVCLEKHRNCLIMPCRHMNSCTECASQIDNCPECRKLIVKRLEVFIN